MSEDHRSDLGRALRALRIAADRTAETVARRASMSPAKLSKIENGKALATVQDVDLILTALGVSGEAKAEFLEAARGAATEATAWRELRRTGYWKHQQSIKAVEARTAVLRLFQGQLIPGLLQSAEYIAAVFALHPELPDESKAKTIAARLERQGALYDSNRSFHFVICEHVLRWMICRAAVMATQLDRLVIVETFHSEITTREPKEVALYLSTFAKFNAAALHGNEMRALVEGIRDELLR
ncbi:Scr1 family TA system antitoxin-like transcriptional regulator [Kitasatospora phosalacinea]|uniref:Scr1 family TA system antitoxin-like transcriptional regulator n=1 Tax=Kitasatospora phosalacinea TaxID=2065 RepID=UPI00364C112F